MAYDEGAAERIREWFGDRPGVVEKKMFGGLSFMLAGNLCCGVLGDTLLARIGPEQHAAALARPHARVMDFTGRPMKGYIVVGPAGFETDAELAGWLSLSLAYVQTLPPK